MDKDFILWLCDNFRIIDGDKFYYKNDLQYVKTRFSLEYLQTKFSQGKTTIT